MRTHVYVQRLAVGLTAPVLTYMALSLIVPVHDGRLILLAGSGWCAAVWACYFLGLHLREVLRRPPRFERDGRTHHA